MYADTILLLDQTDVPTPSLTRSSSSASEFERTQEDEIDTVVQSVSQLKISNSAKAKGFLDLEEPCDLDESSVEPGGVFFDKPGSYVDKEPQAIFEEPEGMDPESMEPDNIESVAQPATNEGSRKALLIGVRYLGNDQIPTLMAAHHDVYEVKKLLIDFCGWSPECIRVLKDTKCGSAEDQPSIENIRYEIKQLVKDARPGDHLFFYFSGHGGQQEDQDGDEEDGMDEFLVSCDGERLVDDEIHEILVKPIPEGCRLTALLDSCHSGTGLDLPFNALHVNKLTRDPLSAKRKQSRGNVVLFSACADNELAREMPDGNGKRIRGMLTKAFIDSLKVRRKSTYDELITSVRAHLERKQTMQNPQFSSSRMLNMNEYFDL